MKREMNLLRDILFHIEAFLDYGDYEMSEDLHKKFDQEISLKKFTYHVKLLCEAGFLECKDSSADDGESYIILSISNSGHDFLDSIRDKTVWEKIIVKLRESGGGYTLTFVGELAKDLLKQNL